MAAVPQGPPQGIDRRLGNHHHGSAEGVFEGQSVGYKRVLWLVIAVNGAMFAIEMAAGAFADSRALQADALDFLGDTATYAITLLAIGASLHTRASVAVVKGISLAALGLWVLGTTAYEAVAPGLPKAEVMGIVGFLALAANLASVLLLLRYRAGDANVRSVWLCSRNDAIGNVAVVIAAGAVWLFGSAWPDLVVAAMISSLFLWSAASITRQAVGELRRSSIQRDPD